MRLNHEWTQIDTNEIPLQVDSKTGSPNGGREMEPKTELKLTLVRSYLVTFVTTLWHRRSRQLRELRKYWGSEGEHEAGLDAVPVYYMAMPKR